MTLAAWAQRALYLAWSFFFHALSSSAVAPMVCHRPAPITQGSAKQREAARSSVETSGRGD